MTTPLPESSAPENASEDAQGSEIEYSKDLRDRFESIVEEITGYQDDRLESPEYDSRGKLIEPAISIVSFQRSRRGSIYQIKVLPERE